MAWVESFDAFVRTHLPALRVEQDAKMAHYTSFRIGGGARRMAFPRTEEDVERLLSFCREHEVPCLVIGKGTNLLISDQGLDQLVLNMLEMNAIRVEGTRVYVQAGALLSHVAVAAQKAGCAGLAFAHGIPGSLGGAVAMNAGAYGGEMQQVVESVTALFPDGLRTLRGESAALWIPAQCVYGGEGSRSRCGAFPAKRGQYGNPCRNGRFDGPAKSQSAVGVSQCRQYF